MNILIVLVNQNFIQNMLTLVNHIISGSQNPSHFLTMFFHYKEPDNRDKMKVKQDHHNNM